MVERNGVESASGWGRFLRKHWIAFGAFVGSAILAFIGVVYVFVWFTANSQTTGLVPATLNLWTMNNLVLFILYAIFWELALIGIPVAIGAVVGWQWWKRLPDAEKTQYHLSGKSSRSGRAGGVITPLFFVVFALKIYVDGNWHVAISAYALDYVVGSVVTILIWVAAIFAVPAAVGLIWWMHHERSKKAESD